MCVDVVVEVVVAVVVIEVVEVEWKQVMKVGEGEPRGRSSSLA